MAILPFVEDLLGKEPLILNVMADRDGYETEQLVSSPEMTSDGLSGSAVTGREQGRDETHVSEDPPVDGDRKPPDPDPYPARAPDLTHPGDIEPEPPDARTAYLFETFKSQSELRSEQAPPPEDSPKTKTAKTSTAAEDQSLFKAQTTEQGDKSYEGGRRPIETERKIYRPKLPSLYQEPELGPDLLDGMDWIFQDFGSAVRVTDELPPRDDIIVFDEDRHRAELERNIRWKNCPLELRPRVTSLIEKYWDVFCSEGLRRNIRGVACAVDTGDAAPVCCRPPRYGPHESAIMTRLCDALEANGLIEDDDGPWGAPIVLATKPGQRNVPWDQYIWRLCVSYRKLNQVVRQFAYPVPRCDDAVLEISPAARFFIALDLDAGYWQIAIPDLLSRAKLAFFAPHGKKRWTVMPMGYINSHSIFVAMMALFQKKWGTKAKTLGLLLSGSKVIVDDVLLFDNTVDDLFAFFELVLQVLMHHRATIKLKKCTFFDLLAVEFVGVDTGEKGNSPARSKYELFEKLDPPQNWSDLRMVVGLYGFYQQWLFNYELRIKPYRSLQAKQPRPGELSPRQEQMKMAELWEADPHLQPLFDELKTDLLSGPVLARPDPNRRFYVKTDWSKEGMGAVLCQADPEDDDAVAASEADDKREGPSKLERTRSGPRLRPVAFISRSTTAAEKSYHSYMGEASAGRWAFGKWKKWLLGREFTWLADCSGLKRFFEGTTDIPTSQIQRWRVELLQFQFALEHRSAGMVTECDMLSRYNAETRTWYEEELPSVHLLVPSGARSLFPERYTRNDPVPSVWATLPAIEHHGNAEWRPTEETKALDATRSTIAHGMYATPIREAIAGVSSMLSTPWLVEDGPVEVRRIAGASATEDFFAAITEAEAHADWYTALYLSNEEPPLGSRDPSLIPWLTEQCNIVYELAERSGLSAALLWVPHRVPNGVAQFRTALPRLPSDWSSKIFHVSNVEFGGSIDTIHNVMVFAHSSIVDTMSLPARSEEPGLMEPFLADDPGQYPTDALRLSDFTVTKPSPVNRAATESKWSPRVKRYVRGATDVRPNPGFPVFDECFPAPNIYATRPEESFFAGPFAVWLDDRGFSEGVCRAVRLKELFLLLGVQEQQLQAWARLEPQHLLARARTSPGLQAITAVLSGLLKAENTAASTYGTIPIMMADPTPTTVLPLPSEQQWIDATQADDDLQAVSAALEEDVQLAPTDVRDKRYVEPFRRGQLELDNGRLFCYDQCRTARVRQLRTLVVPPSLRRVVVAACHSSPFGGHSGVNRTLARIQARFWWPGMTQDVHEGVRGCAHCNLSNATSHEAQLELQTMPCDRPFDVVFLDFWSPGEVPDKRGTVKMLTYLDCMSGFAMGTFFSLKELQAEQLASGVVASFFTTVGLPRLIIVDADGRFAGLFKSLFALLRVPVEAVSRENHKAIRNENFHRYLNKVERINTANTSDLFRWKQGALFSLYAWNASPVDGTDIPRSMVAIGREFPFPIDLSTSMPSSSTAEGQQALDHFEAASPLLYKQRALLGVLNAERRQRHIDLRNASANGVEFAVGDLVIVRKQVKSDASKQFSAKLVFKTRGPYRVLGKVHPNSYQLRKLPFLRGLGRRGRIVKESAARMTKLPSTLVFHKMADGPDTRFGLTGGPYSESALEQWLGVIQCGAYIKAANDPNWAFERLDGMWSDELPDDNAADSDDDDDDDGNVPRVDATEADETPEAIMEEPAPLFRVPPSDTDRKALKKLRKAIHDSLGRVVVVKQGDHSFKLGVIDWNVHDPDLATRFGIYPIQWLVPQHEDVLTRRLTECRFWPDIRKFRADGTIGDPFPVRPGKVKSVVNKDDTLIWPSTEVDLAHDLLVGPFDLCTMRVALQGRKRQAISETDRVDDVYWRALESRAVEMDVDVSHMRLVPRS